MRNRLALPFGAAVALTLWALGRAVAVALSHAITGRA